MKGLCFAVFLFCPKSKKREVYIALIRTSDFNCSPFFLYSSPPPFRNPLLDPILLYSLQISPLYRVFYYIFYFICILLDCLVMILPNLPLTKICAFVFSLLVHSYYLFQNRGFMFPPILCALSIVKLFS